MYAKSDAKSMLKAIFCTLGFNISGNFQNSQKHDVQLYVKICENGPCEFPFSHAFRSHFRSFNMLLYIDLTSEMLKR